MIRASRRSVLAGLAGLAATAPLRAGPAPRPALDRAAALAPTDPAAALRVLDGVAADDAGGRLDLAVARAGLAIDTAITRIAPTGRPGRAPYHVTAAAGAWRAASDPAAIDADTDAVRADAAAGVVLPRPLLERLVGAMATPRQGAAGAAVARQADVLRGLIARAPAQPGLARLPRGREWYALILRRQTGDAVTPAAAERRLLAERAALARRAAALFAAIGDTRGSIGTRYTRLFRDPAFLYPDSQAGRDRAVADMNRTLAAIGARLDSAFAPLPGSLRDVGVRRLSAAEEAAGQNGYRALPAPGRPGAYIVDLRDIGRRPSWSLPSVVAHELLPGHMIQLPLEEAATPHPLRIDYAAGFAEGWGVWAEVLAARQGWLGADPRVMLGHLHWLSFRVERGLADIALHWHGRDAATVRAEMERAMGEPAYFAPFAVDMDRIPVEPASRAGDALFWLAIQDAAGRRSGAALRSFHTSLLAHGRVRTDMIARL